MHLPNFSATARPAFASPPLGCISAGDATLTRDKKNALPWPPSQVGFSKAAPPPAADAAAAPTSRISPKLFC